VLLQFMVVEEAGTDGFKAEDIPRSGVILTSETGKAASVTVVQATHGLCEGVVESRVPTDTFYIGTSGRPYPVIRKKTTRIVHQPTDNESYETVLQDNPLPVLQLGWSIPKKLFPGIKLLSNKVHELYGESIDIEFTAKLRTKKSAKPTIFLTQARPEMVTNASQEKKTFLDLANVKAIPNRGFVATQTLLGCGEFVRTVSHPDHIIIADDLDQAVQLHNKDDENKTKLIISKRGTIGSHFATILKNRGIPVFITHDPHIHHQVKCLVNKVESQHPLLACSQRGMLVALKKTLDKHKMIRKGFCTYPIPLERSLQPHSMTNLKPTTPEVVAVLHVAHLNGRYRRLLERTINNLPPTDKSPRELIETMALGETWEAKQALGYLVKMLFCCFTKELRETHPQGRSNLKNFLRVMETILEEAEKELLPALTEYAPQTAERLFYIRQLEALAFQAYQNSIVQGYSFYTEMTLMHQINILKGAVRNKKALYDPLALPLFLAHKKAFKDGCAKNWRTFIEELRNSKDGSLALHSCARLVNDMQRINLLPYWLNIIFTQAWKENRKKRNRADIILKRLNKVHENNKETLDWVKQKWKLLKEKDSQVSLWRYPAFVKENLGDFHNNFVEDIELTQKKGRPSLISRYSQTDILGRLALLELLDRAVDIIDRTIKSTKGSTDYDDPVQQAKDYARMIPSFFQILQSTLKLISKEDENKLMKPNHGLRVSFDEYLDKLQNGGEYQYDWQRRYSKGYQVLCKEVKDEKGNVLLQMEPRQKFNVAPLVPGSKADLDHSVFWPERLEEYVMLFHQATIKMTQHERKKCGLNLKIVPPELKQICQIIENKFDTEISNIWNDNATLHVIYNIPVRQHSARLDVLYKLDSPTEGVQLHVDCFGVNEFRRWDRTAAFAAYLAHNKITSFVDGTSPKINYDLAVGVSFGFNLKKSLNQTTKLITIVHYIIKTFNQLEVDSCSDLISKLKEQTNPFNWNSVDEEFFQDSLYLNAFLMQKFAQKNEEISLLLKAAKNSLIGLSRYKIDDYFHHEEIETLKGYLRDPKYSFIPDNHDSNKDSLKLIAILYLAKAFKENPKEATPAILSLIGNADLIRQHSSIVKALKQLLHIEKKPLDSFKAFWSQKEYALGMELAHKVNDAEMTKQVDVFIEEKTASFEGKKLLTDLASKLYDDGLFEVVDSKIKSHLSSKQCEDLAHRKRRQMRKLHLKNLKSYATDLHDCALQFDKKYRTLVTKSVDSIIGLSQAADFYKDFGVYFKGFEKYLKVSRYGYIPENNSKNTNWLWMAAALNLVKGIESPDEIREETLDALARLITDYREFGQFSEHAYIIKGILDALYKCLENNKLLNNDQVKQKLEKAWGDYTKIPTSPQKKIVLSPE